MLTLTDHCALSMSSDQPTAVGHMMHVCGFMIINCYYSLLLLIYYYSLSCFCIKRRHFIDLLDSQSVCVRELELWEFE